MKTFETNFQEKLKSSDEEHQKWLQNFIEKLELKEETKAQLTEKMKEQWKTPHP